jgi:hypothetical protein
MKRTSLSAYGFSFRLDYRQEPEELTFSNARFLRQGAGELRLALALQALTGVPLDQRLVMALMQPRAK